MQIVPGQGSSQPAGARGNSRERMVTVAGYVMLLVLGILEGLIGTFQYSRALGSVPVGAVAFAVLIGVTCVLGAWGMGRPLGGLLPGAGWLLTSLVLAMGTPGGSVLITSTAAGEWFLFGGAACAAAGVVTGFVRWSPRRPHLAALPGGRGSSAAAGPGDSPRPLDRHGPSGDGAGSPRPDDSAGSGVDTPARGAPERDTPS